MGRDHGDHLRILSSTSTDDLLLEEGERGEEIIMTPNSLTWSMA